MEKIISYLSYQIGNEHFATNVKNVQSIIKYTNLTKVPNMPDFVIGVYSLNGEALPIIDSRIKLNVSNKEITSKTSIVIMECTINNQIVKYGMLVDGVSEVIEIQDEEIKAAPTIGTKYSTEIVDGIYPIKEKFLMILSAEQFISKLDIENIVAA